MPLWGKKDSQKENNKENDVFIRRECKYIGSFAVVLNRVEDRQRFVNEKLLEYKNVKKGIRIIMQITSEGIKVLEENEKTVKMAHAITKIAFSNCILDLNLFAYVGKSTQESLGNHLQAHVFRCKRSIHAQELGSLVSKAFRFAFARSTINRQEKLAAFEADVKKDQRKIRQGGRRWAKEEIARGHDLSGHAERARMMYGLPFNKFASSDSAVVDSNRSPELVSPRTRAITLGATANNADTSQSKNNEVRTRVLSKDAKAANRNSFPGTAMDAKSSRINESQNVDTVPGMEEKDLAINNESHTFINPEKPVNRNSETWADFTNFDSNDCNSDFSKEDCQTETDDKQTNEVNLRESKWFQEGLSREITEEILRGEVPGAFIVRESRSQPGFHALSIRVPQEVKSDGIANYLIEKLPDGFYRISGCKPSFESLFDLVAFYSTIETDLPIKLRLEYNNPMFAVEENTDRGEDDGDPDYENFDSCESIFTELQRRRKK